MLYTLENATNDVLEEGWFDLTYSVPSANGAPVSVSGSMKAFPGKKGGDYDLFQASPFDVAGSYKFQQDGPAEAHIFDLSVDSKASNNPTFTATVETQEGGVALPNAQAPLTVITSEAKKKVQETLKTLLEPAPP
jgi:hypothetical protein